MVCHSENQQQTNENESYTCKLHGHDIHVFSTIIYIIILALVFHGWDPKLGLTKNKKGFTTYNSISNFPFLVYSNML